MFHVKRDAFHSSELVTVRLAMDVLDVQAALWVPVIGIVFDLYFVVAKVLANLTFSCVGFCPRTNVSKRLAAEVKVAERRLQVIKDCGPAGLNVAVLDYLYLSINGIVFNIDVQVQAVLFLHAVVIRALVTGAFKSRHDCRGIKLGAAALIAGCVRTCSLCTCFRDRLARVSAIRSIRV